MNTFRMSKCSDPGIFVRGGPGQSDKEKLWQSFFFCPQLILQKSNGQFISKKSIIFQGSRGGPTFSRGGGSNFFEGGSNCLFHIETHITCDFLGGIRTPCPPLWIYTWSSSFESILSPNLLLDLIHLQTLSADNRSHQPL